MKRNYNFFFGTIQGLAQKLVNKKKKNNLKFFHDLDQLENEIDLKLFKGSIHGIDFYLNIL